MHPTICLGEQACGTMWQHWGYLHTVASGLGAGHGGQFHPAQHCEAGIKILHQCELLGGKQGASGALCAFTVSRAHCDAQHALHILNVGGRCGACRHVGRVEVLKTQLNNGWG